MTSLSVARIGLGQGILDVWQREGYGVPGATASGDKVILPFKRPSGAGALTIYVSSNVADVSDEGALAAFAQIHRVDDTGRILDEYPELTYQPEGDDTPPAFYAFTLREIALPRLVYDLHQAALQAVWYADAWDRPDGWAKGAWTEQKEQQ